MSWVYRPKTSRSRLIVILDTLKIVCTRSLILNSNVSDNIYAMAFKLRMTVDMHGTHTHARFDDLDHDIETFEMLVLLVCF